MKNKKMGPAAEGINPTHVPYWRVNSPTLWDSCVPTTGRADTEDQSATSPRTPGCHKPAIPAVTDRTPLAEHFSHLKDR